MEHINWGVILDPEKEYPVSYTIKQDGTKVIEDAMLKGKDMTENQTKEFVLTYGATVLPEYRWKADLLESISFWQHKNGHDIRILDLGEVMVYFEMIEDQSLHHTYLAMFLEHFSPNI